MASYNDIARDLKTFESWARDRCIGAALAAEFPDHRVVFEHWHDTIGLRNDRESIIDECNAEAVGDALHECDGFLSLHLPSFGGGVTLYLMDPADEDGMEKSGMIAAALSAYHVIDDTAYCAMIEDECIDRWCRASLGERLDWVRDYNATGEGSCTGEVVSVFAIRRDTMPRGLDSEILPHG